jgi:HD-GYP domain-containing protein (c-di-GMP phosphodiesterase class II)
MLAAVPFVGDGAVACARWHHERYDGRGYPEGLSAEAIPLEARIVAVADALDAMTRPRPYRAAVSLATALAEIERSAGTQFDPAAVAALRQAAETGVIRAEPAS